MNKKMFMPTDSRLAELEEITAAKNILKISYAVLKENKEYFSTLPVSCLACTAMLSTHSKVLSKDEYNKKYEERLAKETLSDEVRAELDSQKQDKNCLKNLTNDEAVWVCEFCDIHNRVSSDTIVPTYWDELYLVKRGTQTETEKEEAKDDETDEERDLKDDTNLVFCIDVSGSMGDSHQVTCEKTGTNKSVARIRLIVEAVLKQIQNMAKTHPNRKVALVSFDDRLVIYGDCTTPKQLLSVSLENFEQLLTAGVNETEKLTKPLSDSITRLEAAIKNLKPEGTTALGPALLCSLGLVKNKAGSRVILCTDGLANVGLGSLSGNSDISEKTRSFYNKVGDIAVESGVSISIITVQGTVCRVDALGPLTDRTAGTILRVNPANMDLSDIAANSLIATNVKMRAIIHEGLTFLNTDSGLVENGGSILKKNVGSVTDNNDAYFEYRIKNPSELKKAEVNLEGLDALPLQLQLLYTDLKGNEFIRVLSKQQELTKDQSEAEKEIKPDILAGYVQKESASLALAGKATEAKKKNSEWTGYMNQVVQRNEFKPEAQEAWANFQTQNLLLCDAIDASEALKDTKDQLKKDEITSHLYQVKQMKKK